MDLYQTLIDTSQQTDLVYAFRQTGSVEQIIRIALSDVTGTKISTGKSVPQTQPNDLTGNLFINSATGDLYEFDGSEWNIIGSLIGPQGAQGAQGLTGIQGPQGLEGSQGPTGSDGKNAYEIAVGDGYSGTAEEWLASLKGDTGPKGDTGAQGPIGETGPQGDTGPQGPIGPAGTDATVTSSSIETALGYTPANGSEYLPLTGGTLTGQAIFSGSQQPMFLQGFEAVAPSTITSTLTVDGAVTTNNSLTVNGDVTASGNASFESGQITTTSNGNIILWNTPGIGSATGASSIEFMTHSPDTNNSSVNLFWQENDGIDGLGNKITGGRFHFSNLKYGNLYEFNGTLYAGALNVGPTTLDNGKITTDGSGNLVVNSISTPTTGTIHLNDVTSASGSDNIATQTFTLPYDGIYALKCVTVGQSSTVGNVCQQGFDDFSVYQTGGNAQIQSSIEEQSYTSFGSVSNFAVSLSASGTTISIKSHATDGNTAGTWTWTSRVEWTLIYKL
ncbi:collagen-like protein [Gluconobacter cerinus]|uniref:collagen-like protein n=1 Tax=Gluconobacter cerinus TaxID=38307 RepID=UPI001B8BBEB1|nr:collagen-like protein [Gluconobacter cerinus]MBS0984475.1 collagen-like protein [Gluconobacter cerinus]